jgi:acyl-CoA thioesterase-1
MRRFLTLIVLLTCTPAHAADVPTVLIFGDSLSAGYGIDVDQSWAALTEGGAERIGPALANFEPALIILELGGNDGLRGFPPDRMRGNLEKIIAASKASGAAVVLLGIRIPSNYGPRYTRAFESVFRETAEALDIPWIEFFMEGIALNDNLMQADGIHPNAAAQPKLLDNAWPIIETALGKAD